MTSVKITKKAKKERTIKQDLAVFKTKNAVFLNYLRFILGSVVEDNTERKCMFWKKFQSSKAVSETALT